jgi:hypothetical protein
VHLTKHIEPLLGFGTFFVIFLLLHMVRAAGFLVLPTLVGLLYLKVLYIGMEAGTNMFCLSLCIFVFVYVFRKEHVTPAALAAVSVLLFSAPAARMENVLFSGTLIAIAAFRLRKHVSDSGPAHMLALALPFAALCALYFVVNKLAFGSATPVSALVKAWWAENSAQAGMSWGEKFATLSQMRIVYGGYIAALLAAVVFVTEPRSPRSGAHTRLFGISVVALGVFHTVKVMLYAYGGVPELTSYDWYHVTGPLTVFLATAYVGDRMIVRITAYLARKGPVFETAAPKVILVAAIGAFVVSTIAAYGIVRSHTAARPESGAIDWEIASYRMARWINKNLPDKTRIGAFDSGTLGYFCKTSVTNLDGVINSVAYFEMLKRGELERFLAQERITYITNLVDKGEDFPEYVRRAARMKDPLKGKFEPIFQNSTDKVMLYGVERNYVLFKYTPPN